MERPATVHLQAAPNDFFDPLPLDNSLTPGSAYETRTFLGDELVPISLAKLHTAPGRIQLCHRQDQVAKSQRVELAYP